MSEENGKTKEQLMREEFESHPENFVHRKDIVVAYVRDSETGAVHHLINGQNEGLLKAAMWDLQRIVSNVINSIEMRRAKEKEKSIIQPGQQSMAAIQRRFK